MNDWREINKQGKRCEKNKDGVDNGDEGEYRDGINNGNYNAVGTV